MGSAFFALWLLFVALILVFGVVAVVLAVRRERRDKELAPLVCQRYGLVLHLDELPPPPVAFDALSVGRARRASFRMQRPGEHDAVFRYRYTTGSGKNRHTTRMTAALVLLPFAAPHVKIGSEGFVGALGRVIGVRDIEVESPQFNEIYRVRSDDERFAITLLDQRMIAWMLRPTSGAGAVRFELLGPWLLCASGELAIEQMPGMLAWAQDMRAHMPEVLASLYPVT